MRVLEVHKAAQSRRRLKIGRAWKDGGWAIDDGTGGPVDPDALGRAWRKAREAAGHEGVRLHDLRHL